MARGRALRHWGQLGLQVALILLAAGLFQVAADRTNVRFDLTPARDLSLSPITEKILAELSEPLEITAFYRRGERAPVVALLQRLGVVSPQVQWEAYDLDRYPERARSFGIKQYDRAALEYQGRQRIAQVLPEEYLAGGILAVVRGTSRRLGITGGHGERAPGGDDQSLGQLVAALEAENYAPEVVSLISGPVPEGTDVLVVAGPQKDFLPGELGLLADYLSKGGAVLVLLDPAPLPRLGAFLNLFGVALRDDFIVDHDRRVLGTDGLAAVVEQFRPGNPISHPHTNPIQSGIVLPSSRSVDVIDPAPPGVQASGIARTGETAWAVVDAARARRGEAPSRESGDLPGPVPVIVMAEVEPTTPGAPPGRLVAIGDADFASDAYIDLLGNRDLALNAVAWLAGEEDVLAGARPKQVPEIDRPLSQLVLTEPQARGILFLVAAVMPGLVLLTGLGVVALRRWRG
jgi:ABC-type uncharacterized transport system involved in gliding motility auxiliary subunit